MIEQETKDVFFDFIAPDKEVTLKGVFDNLRNYMLCAAIFGVAKWFQNGALGVPRSADTPISGFASDGYWIFTVLAFVLLFANLLQTILWAKRGLVFCKKIADDQNPNDLLEFIICIFVLWGPIFVWIIFYILVIPMFLVWFAYGAIGKSL